MKEESKKEGDVYYLTEVGSNPRLGAKILKENRASLFLDYNFGIDKKSGKRIRKRERLKMYLTTNPNRTEKAKNAYTIEQAKVIQSHRAIELIEGIQGFKITKKEAPAEIIKGFASWIEGEKKDATKSIAINLTASLNKFNEFCNDRGIKTIYTSSLDVKLCSRFAAWLESNYKGQTPRVYFRPFKCFVRSLVESGVIKDDPTSRIKLTRGNDKEKCILTMEELGLLMRAECKRPEIKRAFLFSAFTGLRWSDVSRLKYRNIDRSAKMLTIKQKKTSTDVKIPLNKTAYNLIFGASLVIDPDKLVFDLPNQVCCTTWLERWVKSCGINKHITWHCSRHSFAVNLLSAGTDIKTTSSLLGHSSISVTERYLHVVDKLKENAVNVLDIKIAQ